MQSSGRAFSAEGTVSEKALGLETRRRRMVENEGKKSRWQPNHAGPGSEDTGCHSKDHGMPINRGCHTSVLQTLD